MKNSKTENNLWDQVLARAREERMKIGIGINKITPNIIKSLERAKEFVDVVVVGKEIDGFESIIADSVEPLIELAKLKKVDSIVRGNFDAIDAYSALKKSLKIDGGILTINFFKLNGVKMLNDSVEGVFCLLPTSFVNERTLQDKIKSIDLHLEFFKTIGLVPKIGVLGPGKLADINEGVEEVTQGITDAQFIVDHYSKKGIWAKFFNHQIEYAVQEANIIVAQNSWAGNLGAHCLLYLGNVDFLGAAALNFKDIVYVDDSEAMEDFTNCLIFASFLASLKREKNR